jgi:hypothetical protein
MQARKSGKRELAAKSCFQLFLGEKRHSCMFKIGFKRNSPASPGFGPAASSSSLINPDGFKSYIFL